MSDTGSIGRSENGTDTGSEGGSNNGPQVRHILSPHRRGNTGPAGWTDTVSRVASDTELASGTEIGSTGMTNTGSRDDSGTVCASVTNTGSES